MYKGHSSTYTWHFQIDFCWDHSQRQMVLLSWHTETANYIIDHGVDEKGGIMKDGWFHS